MNKYKINWSRSDYGYITIEAETEDEARELFESGEYPEQDFIVKNGQIDIDTITLE